MDTLLCSYFCPSPLISFSLQILTIFLLISAASATDSFLYGGCSQMKYTAGSQYESNLNSLLSSLVNSATYSAYNKFTIMASSPQDVVYGLYQCRADTSMPECATCVARAVSHLAPLCPGACGAAVQLEGCFVKYDNVSFIGVEDKAVAMKKCGPSDGFDADQMANRDAMLAGLGRASGPFRVGNSVDVQGVAQCMGDLSTGQCQDCLTEAMRRLKVECGGAVFGDMFLAKCYARYSTNGAHAYSQVQPDHDHSSSHSDSEKTFAIVLGLLAGVVIVIILLTFLRRMCCHSGK